MSTLDDVMNDAANKLKAEGARNMPPRQWTDPSPKRRVPAFVAVAAGAVVAFGLVGLPGLISAFQTDVGTPAESIATEIPPLGFDTAPLGIELPATTSGSPTQLDKASLQTDVQTQIDAGYVLSGSPVFVGRIAQTEGFIALFEHPTEPDLACRIMVEKGQTAGNAMGCGPETDSHVGTFLRASEGEDPTLLVSAWDPTAAVITIELPTGQRYWQRTHNGGSVMAMPVELMNLEGITITVYNNDGDVVGHQD